MQFNFTYGASVNSAPAGFTNNTAIADVSNSWKIETIADFNGDGKSDLIWRHADGFVSIWQMDGSAIASNLAIGQVSQDYKINAYHTPDVDFV